MQDQHKSLRKKKAEYEEESYGGVVTDVSGENPVLNPNAKVPNIIVDNEVAEDWTEGDHMHVQVHTVKDTYMFGKRLKSDDERQEEKAENHQVILKVMSNKMTSETYRDEEDAQEFADFLEQNLDIGRVEIERTK